MYLNLLTFMEKSCAVVILMAVVAVPCCLVYSNQAGHIRFEERRTAAISIEYIQ